MRRYGFTGIWIITAIASGILLALIFPPGFLVFLLCLFLIALGSFILFC